MLRLPDSLIIRRAETDCRNPDAKAISISDVDKDIHGRRVHPHSANGLPDRAFVILTDIFAK